MTRKIVFDAANFPHYKPRKVTFTSDQPTKNSFPIVDAVVFVFQAVSSGDKSIEAGYEELSIPEQPPVIHDFVGQNFTADLLQKMGYRFLRLSEQRLRQIIHLLQLPSSKKRRKESRQPPSLPQGQKKKQKGKSRSKARK